jgi:hypothetical protein
LVEASFSKKRAASIFRAEALASTKESIRRLNPKEHHKKERLYRHYFSALLWNTP